MLEKKFPNLPSKIRVGGAELIKRSSNEYDVFKDSGKIGTVRVCTQIAQVDFDSIKGCIIPYEIKIEIVTSKEELPIETIKKVVMATILMGIS